MFKNVISYRVPFVFIAGVFIIYQLVIREGILPALIFAILPVIGIGCASIFHGQLAFYAFFIINYFIMGISRYFPMKTGMIMLGLTLGLLLLVFLKNIFHPYDWKRSRNFLTVIWLIWFVYCLLEIFNPTSVIQAWNIAINGYAFFPLLSAILIPILFTRYKDLKWLLILWAFLCLLAAAKGYWQRNHGFDSAELYWLLVEGGARTHFIYSGVRYFSFFSDAANYGTSMGLSMTIFGIIGFYVRPIWLKFLFWGTAVASFYGLMISGTRSAVIIPIVGLVTYLILCRNIKYMLFGICILTASLLFLTQTNIGNENSLIRRMRTTFDKDDASMQVRVINKKKMIPLLQDKPFGIGLGLSGGRATRFNVDTPLAKLPPDSSHTATWIETGIVGLLLYFTLLLLILAKASYIAVFVVKDKKLKGILIAFIAGISGVLVAAYANDVTTYPNGILMSILYAFLFTIPYYDKEQTTDVTTT